MKRSKDRTRYVRYAMLYLMLEEWKDNTTKPRKTFTPTLDSIDADIDNLIHNLKNVVKEGIRIGDRTQLRRRKKNGISKTNRKQSID